MKFENFLSLRRLHKAARRVLLVAILTLVPGPFGQASWTNFESGTRGNGDPYTAATWTSSGGSPYQYSSDGNNGDDDSDGLVAMQEYTYGTDPFNPDTDYDGLTDGDEVTLANTNPADWDSNDDGYSDYDAAHNFFGVSYGTPGALPNLVGATFYDYDGDGMKNPVDPFPMDHTNNNSDGDSDGIPDYQDPAPLDPTNYSSINEYLWYSEAILDNDEDGITNFDDAYPTSYWNNPEGDGDGDGIANQLDPFERDPNNFSMFNNVTWGVDVNGNADGDEWVNWSDSFPYISTADDYDVDGIVNDIDPQPNDSSNFSDLNGIFWHQLALADADGDSIANYYDQDPYPPADSDGDGYFDIEDPAPWDETNFSSANGIAWNAGALDDNDEDGIINFNDTFPSDRYNGNPNFDNDTYANEVDPAPEDRDNYSSINAITWYYNALGDGDSDGTDNWHDDTPYGSNPSIDLDYDGILNASDPFPNDINNYSSVNNTSWFGNVLGDTDADGLINHLDFWPFSAENGINIDADGDELSASEEYEAGTSDNDWDSDDDGLSDHEEVVIYYVDHHTSPLDAYSIAKQLNIPESLGYTDYYLVRDDDSDEDGIPDGIEIFYQLNPNVKADAWGDLDADGLSNLDQYNLGIKLKRGLTVYDADGDGMTDFFETRWGFNPNNPADGTGDADNDKVFNYEESKLGINPHNADTRGLGGYGDWQIWLNHWQEWLYSEGLNNPANTFDTPPGTDANANGKPDWAEALAAQAWFAPVSSTDWDGDGMLNVYEHGYGRWNNPIGLQIRIHDAAGDADSDNRSNWYEHNKGSHPLIPTSWQGEAPGGGTPSENVSGTVDADGDGVSDSAETTAGTNPYDWDSDNDGISDGAEAKAGNGTYRLTVFTPLIRPVY